MKYILGIFLALSLAACDTIPTPETNTEKFLVALEAYDTVTDTIADYEDTYDIDADTADVIIQALKSLEVTRATAIDVFEGTDTTSTEEQALKAFNRAIEYLQSIVDDLQDQEARNEFYSLVLYKIGEYKL